METAASSKLVIPLFKSNVRIESVDALRGLVMLIMALDHTRDLFHAGAYTADPLNVLTTTPILFFTRWITHFCAPVFVFLSGTSIYLQGLRKNKQTLAAFLIKRGLWLIIAELTVITFGITFNIYFSLFLLQVIWALGISMVLLSLAIRLPFRLLLALGLVIVLGHNALDFWEAGHPPPNPVWYHLLHRPSIAALSKNYVLGIFYPFLPWTGVMILGYCFGKIYQSNSKSALINRVISIGIALIILFIIVRFINIYGDPIPWSTQKRGRLYTILSFINTQKYPPSLLFICMTMGPALLLLAFFEKVQNKLTNIFSVYGKVPLFYFIIHFYLLHTLCAILFLSRGHSFREGVNGVPYFPFKFIIPGQGYSLFVVYLIWIALVIFLYPLCSWYGKYKHKHRYWWLSYL